MSSCVPAKTCLLVILLLLAALTLPSGLMAQKLSAENVILLYENKAQLENFNRRAQASGLIEDWSDSGSPEIIAGLHVSGLVSRVEGILGVYPEHLQFNIAIFDTNREVQAVYRILYGRDTDFISFYSPRTETVYISLEALKPRIIIHEITHAVVHHYYEKPTPVTVHELLAQYVEAKF